MTYRLTRQSARAAGACYSDDRIAELVPEEGLTAAEVADLDIPYQHIHWALVYAMGAPDSVLRLHAVACVRRALARAPDSDISDACDVAERYANGEATREEMRAVRGHSVVWPSADDAAYASAEDFACIAVGVSPLVYTGGMTASQFAAYSAERMWQVVDLARRLS